jgi:hypothetical protein
MRLTSILLGLLLGAALAGPALAHQAPRAAEPPAALPLASATADVVAAPGVTTAVDLPVLGAMALALVALALLPLLSRRALVIAVVLVLSVLAFESGVHSAHHLGQPDATCLVAAGTTHLHGTTPAPVTADTTQLAPGERLVQAESLLSDSALARSHQGRAPPALA